MRRRQFTWPPLALALAPVLWGLAGASRAALGMDEAATGVRAALERGAAAAVQLLGRTDGFLGNPRVRIPLPGPLEDAARLLSRLGQGQRVDDLVTAMNRAAEQAVPEARDLLLHTVRQISVEDAIDLVRGGPTSVTDFFARKTRVPLHERFLPIVTRATERVQLAARYNAFAARAAGVGLIRGDQANLQQHVTARALDGLYLVIGDEEQRIRANPAASGSAILRKVFAR